MSIQVMSRVWEASRQSGGALIVLLAIADFADDGGVAFPSVGTLARKARLSQRQVQRVVSVLIAEGELCVEPGCGRRGSHLYRVVVGRPRQDVTPDKMSAAARHRRRGGVTPVTGQTVTPASPEPSTPEPSTTDTPRPPSGEQRQGERRWASEAHVPPVQERSDAATDQVALELAAALYRGLGGDLKALTGPVRRRELAIAAQLVAVGATPVEAEAYAREVAAQPSRLAPIDVRGFERERASWLARREGARSTRRYVDRTGQGIAHRPPDTPPGTELAAGVDPPPTSQLPGPATADRAWLRVLQVRLEGTDHAG